MALTPRTIQRYPSSTTGAGRVALEHGLVGFARQVRVNVATTVPVVSARLPKIEIIASATLSTCPCRDLPADDGSEIAISRLALDKQFHGDLRR